MPSGNLQILNARNSDSGSYRCIAHNPYLREKMYANHFVNLKVSKPKHTSHNLRSLRFVSTTPENVNAIIGSNITLECVAHGFPVPKVSWNKQNGELPKGRAFFKGGNLIITTVHKSDEGAYTCSASNGKMVLTSNSMLQIYEMPQILGNAYETIDLYEGHQYELICNAEGQPKPIISWLHNGYFIDSNSMMQDTSFDRDSSILRISRANIATHSGIFQCFATNELGSTYATKVVNIKSLHESFIINQTEEVFKLNTKASVVTPIDNKDDFENNLDLFPEEENVPNQHHVSHKKKHRNKESNSKMIPPSKPEVSMLNDDSVMVRWTVPKSVGLPIMFFKVQFKELSKGDWNTVDEDIPPHINTYAVVGLNPNATYRFRIAAVYSNDDNKNGKSSNKFHFKQDPLIRKPSHPPIILNAVSMNSTEILIQWKFLNIEVVPIDGFFIYYRATDSAGEYLKVTSLGIETSTHNITHLIPNTAYEIKMRCFNSAGTSEFSNIYTVKTLPNKDAIDKTNNNKLDYENIDTDLLQNNVDNGNIGLVSTSLNLDNNKMQLIALVTVSIALVLVIVACLVICIIRQKNQAPTSKVISKSKPLKPSTPSDYYFTSTNVYQRRSNGQPSISPSTPCLPQTNKETESDSTPNGVLTNPNNDMPFLTRKNSLRNSLSYSTHHLFNSSTGKAVDASANHENTATIDRKRSLKSSVDPYFDYPKFNNHSASFTRLNGTLERKRRSRTDLNTLDKQYLRHISTNEIDRQSNNNANYFPPNGQIMIMQSSC